MEEQAERRSVGLVVTIQVVVQEVVELFARDYIRTLIDHRTAAELFVERRIISSIQLVHDHFPNSVTSCWTVLKKRRSLC